MSEEIQLEKYDNEFFKLQSNNDKKHRAASVISKIALDYCPNVKSVVDVGCGIGVWPNAFKQRKVPTVHGVDGGYVSKDYLLLDETAFIEHDLRDTLTLNRTYDLACSLEVAEHLPPSRARSFVEDLTKLAPVVLFSAAIPGQGGENHINEMWQHHWARLFVEFNYTVIDCIRPIVWSMTDMQVCYRQNTLMYAHESVLTENEKLRIAAENTNEAMLPLVHPRTLVRLEKQWKSN